MHIFVVGVIYVCMIQARIYIPHTCQQRHVPLCPHCPVCVGVWVCACVRVHVREYKIGITCMQYVRVIHVMHVIHVVYANV
jgi:hypothetical protein